MCDERDREIIRIDFQVIELKKQQEAFDVDSKEYQVLQGKIDKLDHHKERIKAERAG